MVIAQPGEQPTTYANFSQVIAEEKEPPIPENTLCNCYQFVKSVYPSLPSTNEILSNLSPTGPVAVFYYANTGLHHYAVVRGETETTYLIEETNYSRCKHGTREIPKSDQALIGFYTP